MPTALPLVTFELSIVPPLRVSLDVAPLSLTPLFINTPKAGLLVVLVRFSTVPPVMVSEALAPIQATVPAI